MDTGNYSLTKALDYRGRIPKECPGEKPAPSCMRYFVTCLSTTNSSQAETDVSVLAQLGLNSHKGLLYTLSDRLCSENPWLLLLQF